MSKTVYKLTLLAFALAGLSALPSCSGKQAQSKPDTDSVVVKDTVTAQETAATDTPQVEEKEEATLLTEEEAEAIVRKLWKGIPERKINSNTSSSLTPEFYSLVKKAYNLYDSLNQDMIGAGENIFCWYIDGQDSDNNAHIGSVSITDNTPEKFTARVKWVDYASDTFTLKVKKCSDGTWRIDDFIHSTIGSHKAMIRRYLKNPNVEPV